MTKAEEIARALACDWDRTHRWRAGESGSYDSPFPTLQAMIAAALEKFDAEERERCAKIADAEARQKTFTQSWRDCAERIAARIREGK